MVKSKIKSNGMYIKKNFLMNLIKKITSMKSLSATMFIKDKKSETANHTLVAPR